MKTILILEDDIDLGGHWQQWLEEAGYRVVHETYVEGALEVVDSEKVDLILCDVLIGNHKSGFSSQGGLTLLSHVMLNVEPKPRSLVITGANPALAMDRHAQLMKADGFLSKPLAKPDLLSEVHALLLD